MNIHKPQEMEESLSDGSMAQRMASHTQAHLESCLVAPFHPPSVRRQSQGVKHSPSTIPVVRVFCHYSRHLCSIFGLPTPGVLCAFLSCVGQTFSLLRTLCSSWTSSLSEMFPLWASLCVGRRVCKRLVGGRRPAANGTYCCIAGARLSGSLPAI